MLALEKERHTEPTPIQAAAIPAIMSGRDLLGIAQTGTGKTAAFALPILNRLSKTTKRREPRTCRVLVLTPTRELALQIVDRFKAYGEGLALTTGLVMGGAAYGKQRAMLTRGVDILVATPGRLIDIIDRGALTLNGVETFVLDEVDQMLDLGFIHAIRSIAAKLPDDRQNIFFSATMPPAISKLANGLLRDPARVEMAASKPLKIEQSVMFMEKGAKASALIDLVKRQEFARGLVFTRTKHGADKLVRTLIAAGAPAHAIHGNRSQAQREKALAAFRGGHTRILVATDIAARGIDVRDVTHVVNYDLPNMPETYTHRIGRTGRAGATGIAVSFCSAEERPFLKAIEKLTRQTITVQGRDNAADAHKIANENRRAAPSPRAAENRTNDRRNADGSEKKGQKHGERGTDRVRRRRHRGAPGRQLSGQAG